MRYSPPAKGAASSGSEMHGSSGTCRAICYSSLDSGVGEAEAAAGATGSLLATFNISRFRRSPPSSRGQNTGRPPAPLHKVLLGVFPIGPCTSGEPWLGQSCPPSSLPSSHGFCGNPLGEGSPSSPIPPDRVGWSTSHPSFPVLWAARKPWLVGGPVF